MGRRLECAKPLSASRRAKRRAGWWQRGEGRRERWESRAPRGDGGGGSGSASSGRTGRGQDERCVHGAPARSTESHAADERLVGREGRVE